MNTRGLRRLLSVAEWFVSLTASRTLVQDDNLKTFVFNAAAGLTVTLPAARGTGFAVSFLVNTTVTSNADVIKVANTTDVIQGIILGTTDTNAATNNVWAAAAADDTITMDGSTRGGIKGDRIDLHDMAAGFWQVTGWIQSSGTEATPFSATV